MKTKIKVDPNTGLAYFSKALRAEGFFGDIDGLPNCLTLTLIRPGTRLCDVKRSLENLVEDIALRIDYENAAAGGSRENAEPRD